MSDREELLLRDAIAGNIQALTALLEQHGPSTRNKLRGRIPSRWRALLDDADVMQVTYLEAFLNIRRFEPRGPRAFRAWLLRIARNNLSSALRCLSAAKRPDSHRAADPPSTCGESSDLAMNDFEGDDTTPSCQVRQKEALEKMRAALDTLPDDYRAVVELYDLEGRSVQEVAVSLERSIGAVFMLRARALDRLRETLGDSVFPDAGVSFRHL